MTKKCDFCTEPCEKPWCPTITTVNTEEVVTVSLPYDTRDIVNVSSFPYTKDNMPTFNYVDDDSVFDIDAILEENEHLKEKVAHLEQLLLSVTGHLVIPTPEKEISHEELWSSLDDDLEYLSQEESEEIIRKSIAEEEFIAEEELEAFFKRVDDAIKGTK